VSIVVFEGFDHLLHVICKFVYLLDHAAGSCAMNRESLTSEMNPLAQRHFRLKTSLFFQHGRELID